MKSEPALSFLNTKAGPTVLDCSLTAGHSLFLVNEEPDFVLDFRDGTNDSFIFISMQMCSHFLNNFVLGSRPNFELHCLTVGFELLFSWFCWIFGGFILRLCLDETKINIILWKLNDR